MLDGAPPPGGLANAAKMRILTHERSARGPTRFGPPAQPMEDVMAKGQMRANKEKKKPKAEWNKNKKGGREPPRYAQAGQPQIHGQDPFGKK
jgi:hypothetical protein